MPGASNTNASGTSTLERTRSTWEPFLPPLETVVGDVEEYMHVMDQYLAILDGDLVAASRPVHNATAATPNLDEGMDATDSHEVQDLTIAAILSSIANEELNAAVGQETEGFYGDNFGCSLALQPRQGNALQLDGMIPAEQQVVGTREAFAVPLTQGGTRVDSTELLCHSEIGEGDALLDGLVSHPASVLVANQS